MQQHRSLGLLRGCVTGVVHRPNLKRTPPSPACPLINTIIVIPSHPYHLTHHHVARSVHHNRSNGSSILPLKEWGWQLLSVVTSRSASRNQHVAEVTRPQTCLLLAVTSWVMLFRGRGFVDLGVFKARTDGRNRKGRCAGNV